MNILGLALVLGTVGGAADQMNAGQIAHALDRLAENVRVLYVAAHPDDENTRLLSHLANIRHVHAGYLSLTRGGGGQNLIGREQGVLLDLIRTEELLAARRIDGAVQRFTRARDFGYSKSAAETLEVWGKEEVLGDVVRVLREFQPDFIVTRFDTRPPNHGHHISSAILAREAFFAAADPTRFPEQNLEPWKTRRLFHNLTPWRPKPEAQSISIDVGAYDPRLGLGMGELAALSRSQHKSQGFGASGERGVLVEKLELLEGEPVKKDPLEGVERGWKRYGDKGVKLDALLLQAKKQLSRDDPSRAFDSLLKARSLFLQLPDQSRVKDARRQIDRLLAASAGLFIRATSPRHSVTPGEELSVEVEVVSGLSSSLRLNEVSLAGVVERPGIPLKRNEKQVVKLSVAVPRDAPVSTPYWLNEPPRSGLFEVSEPSLIGAPRGPAPFVVKVSLGVKGQALGFEVPVLQTWTDRVHGERSRELLVTPPATVTPIRESVLLPEGRGSTLALRVKATRDDVTAKVDPGLPAGWSAEPATHEVKLEKAGDETTIAFVVRAEKSASPVEIQPSVMVDGRAWSYREDLVDYPHIPVQLVLQRPRVKLVPLPVNIPSGLIGYVTGSGDSIASDLVHLGAQVELIDDETLRAGDLSRFSAIVVGIRAYNVRPALVASHARLMKYVEEGGRVLVQYVTRSRWEPLDIPLGPYPFEVTAERITDEKAEVVFLDPGSRLLSYPNRIGKADFEGWVQERGIYFSGPRDERYRPLFSMSDPGEAPLEGSTIVARHGKGRYVYTGLSFFRQLPAGVPGAYRLFLNLLAED